MRSKNPEYCIRIESFVNNYFEKYGMVPSNAEISKETRLSTATVSRYIAYMKEEGRIEVEGHRSIRTAKMRQRMESTVSIPVLGDVSCGLPKYVEENIEGYLSVSASVVDDANYYFLRAKGDSMIEIGISSGDLLLIRQQNNADVGQIVVALVDDEVTLKRFFLDVDNKRIRLHPENSSMADIFTEKCEIQGIAVKVIKDLI